jgi:hypothetical protein
MTFAIDDTSSGTFTATTTETASESSTTLPPPDDDLTVNSGVTVESTGGDVVLISGDSIVTQAGSLVKSDTGKVNLTVGISDNDNDATLELSGGISSTNVTLSSPGDICVSGITATGTVTITSTGGAILDCGDSPDATDITASTVNLNAATGIGVFGTGVVSASDAAIEIQASSLSFSNSTSRDVNIINVSGNLSASGTNSASNAAINLAALGGGTLTVQPVNAVQAVTVTGSAGTFTLTFNGQTTSALAFNATAAQVQNALQGLSTIGSGNVAVSQSGNVYTVTFTGALAASSQPQITGSGSGGASVSVSTVTQGTPCLMSNNGNITLSADAMTLTGTVNAGTAIVTLQQAGTTTRTIDVGLGTMAGDLGLSDADLGQVTAGILRIGRTDNTGSITITAPVTTHPDYSTLDLRSGSTRVLT